MLVCMFIAYQHAYLYSQPTIQIYNVQLIKKNKAQDPGDFKDSKIHINHRIYLYHQDSLVVIYDSIIDTKIELSSNQFMPFPKFINRTAISVYHLVHQYLYDLMNNTCLPLDDKNIPKYMIHPLPNRRIEVKFRDYPELKLWLKKSKDTTFYPFYYNLFPGYLLERLEYHGLIVQLQNNLTKSFYLSENTMHSIIQEIQNIACSNKTEKLTFEKFVLGKE